MKQLSQKRYTIQKLDALHNGRNHMFHVCKIRMSMLSMKDYITLQTTDEVGSDSVVVVFTLTVCNGTYFLIS